MDWRSEARDFLQSRRARLDPATSGLGFTTGRRRVPGLRREEVALLAGVSVDYYTRLEKGRLESASYAVLDAIAQALQLDQAERSHLHDLARAARGESSARTVETDGAPVRASLVWMLESMSLCPAYVRNGSLDVVASNSLARALWSPMFRTGAPRPNLAAFCFLDASARDFFQEWPDVARGTIALLRAEVGRRPTDPSLDALIQRLSSQSEDFKALWTEHEVLDVFDDVKRLTHPRVGPLTLALEGLSVISDNGLTMVAYAAEPGSASETALRLLADLSPAQEGSLVP